MELQKYFRMPMFQANLSLLHMMTDLYSSLAIITQHNSKKVFIFQFYCHVYQKGGAPHFSLRTTIQIGARYIMKC